MKKIAFFLSVLMLAATGANAQTSELPQMTVWKSPWCGCCGGWIKHVEAAGFKVVVNDVEDLDMIKSMAGIPDELESCHTAVVGNYKIEGHVPVADIKKLLATKPDVHGLAVPGMPSGSPGMENGDLDPYKVMTFTLDGKTAVFNQYN
ncbi:CopG protein [hydrothermal vent metagenome]|uniref:CopG protein n=1 Tax=hydrothermal vent metagenome TaxID=652676 RepID=A0A3B0TXH2_9ZZZZ